MKSYQISLVDQGLQRRLKPYQNLSFLMFALPLVIILPLLIFESEFLSVLLLILMLLSAVFLALFILLSLSFFTGRKVGIAQVSGDRLIYCETSYVLEDIRIELSISRFGWENARNKSKQLKGLPSWGNYIILPDGEKLEFRPATDMLEWIDEATVSGFEKRPVLLTSTRKLLSEVLTFWGSLS